MNKLLVVIDMQNDFISGTLGTIEAQSIVNQVRQKVSQYEGLVYFTQDTHFENYLETQEGRKLPIKHCLQGTKGWEIIPELQEFVKENVSEKSTFGSLKLLEVIQQHQIDDLELIGVCSDICVMSHALLIKTAYPELSITVDARCCAGSTPQAHQDALSILKSCQIDVINEGETNVS